MKLESFRELLIKKADSDEVKFLAKYVKDDILENVVIESLEKMALMGNSAKDVTKDWAGESTEHDHDMLRDAIGHHVSRYNAANKANDKKAGDMHLQRAVHLMNFAKQASAHSDMKFDHVPTQAWEMNYSGPERKINSKGKEVYADNPEGLKRRTRGPGSKFPDYRYLEQEPHEVYLNASGTKNKVPLHRGKYPFEEIKINGKHIDIDHDHEHDVEKGYEDHEIDHHPAFKNRHSTGYRSQPWEKGLDKGQDAIDKHDEEVIDWESNHKKAYLQRIKDLKQADPEAHANRGKEMSEGIGSWKRDPEEDAADPFLSGDDDDDPDFFAGHDEGDQSAEPSNAGPSEEEVAMRREKHKHLVESANNMTNPEVRDHMLKQIDNGEFD
jgi:hypothetical protein